jgi:hypothetical protein
VNPFLHHEQADAVDDVMLAVREHVCEDLPAYTDALCHAFKSANAIFTTPRYAEFFWHCASRVPGWIADVVLANATKESEGATKLFWLWQRVNYNDEVESGVLRHAKDESRHSRLFLELARVGFPALDGREIERLGGVLPDVRRVANAKSDGVISEEDLIDHLIQMNIGEIRTRIHVQFLAPVIHAVAPNESRNRVRQILRGLIHDEVHHIGYTAKLMERWARAGDAALIKTLYAKRLQDFNLITIQETEGAVRAFGGGQFPDLLEI